MRDCHVSVRLVLGDIGSDEEQLQSKISIRTTQYHGTSHLKIHHVVHDYYEEG